MELFSQRADQKLRSRETSFGHNARTAATATNPPTIRLFSVTDPAMAALWVVVAEAAAKLVVAVAADAAASVPEAEPLVEMGWTAEPLAFVGWAAGLVVMSIP